MDNATLSFDVYHPQPLLVVISGPSGVGKDAVVKAMQKRGQPFHFVVTMTSRQPRAGEVDGVDYFFTQKENFERMIAADEFVEVTPKSIRLRNRHLKEHDRKRASREAA